MIFRPRPAQRVTLAYRVDARPFFAGYHGQRGAVVLCGGEGGEDDG